MNEEQQKLLWLQLNKEFIYTAAAKADSSVKNNNAPIEEIVKMTRYVRRKKKKD